MKTLTNSQFELIVQQIQDKIDYEFESQNAKVFGVMLNDNFDIQFEPVKTGADVYELIGYSPEVYAAVNEYDLITIATCGWAAPNDDNKEIAPSQHPERRRVRLLTTANTNYQFGSSISFKDNPDEPVFDYGNAKGALADAIIELINSATEKR
jgi:hypothetical protein